MYVSYIKFLRSIKWTLVQALKSCNILWKIIKYFIPVLTTPMFVLLASIVPAIQGGLNPTFQNLYYGYTMDELTMYINKWVRACCFDQLFIHLLEILLDSWSFFSAYFILLLQINPTIWNKPHAVCWFLQLLRYGFKSGTDSFSQPCDVYCFLSSF